MKFRIKRVLKNTFATKLLIRKYFSKKDIQHIEKYIGESEKKHQAEIRVVIEAHLSFVSSIKNISIQKRCIDLFSILRIWDTEDNNGVLIYLLLAEKKIQILADRGIYHKHGQKYWDAITKEATQYFKKEEYTDGLLFVLSKITDDMIKIFPAKKNNKNELSNKVIRL